ncbi:DNA polymerase/3'-5' exonuclease PolX [Trinickia soli]|uniref:DNA polymerase beta n=1 Tax=Trinickia soli TaxID=380675 RepID=A0A2N7WG36_9BURK|nr:DNA polymerase/3'-5' exonuclease PolX [Trinickia soli]PMS28426.1 DNA polymerase/3'-5' exonuclease PolX [Trinickia soli]CAB3669747.1 DNA polymerase/3'-5' exonuclease PolX [Trinickia soli]
MPLHNAEIAAIFVEIADLLEIQGQNPFRVRAYRNAARSVGEFGKSVATMIEQNEDLKVIPGIGDDLAGKMREIAATGKCDLLERLHNEMPAAITELLQVQGLGPKRVRAIHDALHVQTIEELHQAAKEGRIRELPGFGEVTEGHIVDTIEAHLHKSRRFRLALAEQYAQPLIAWLKATPGTREVVAAGSFRRRAATVGDLDILVTAHDAAPVMQRFVRYEEVAEVLSRGATRASITLRNRMQVDLRVVAPASFGAALVYFTGSKAHNIAMRRIAQEHGLKINEYGVFRKDKRIAGATEESVYEAIGLPWIPAELRENRGELQAARAHRLPTLIERSDLRGDLHAHTSASDGHDTMLDMALAARERGLSYLAITDHSSRLAVARGLDTKRLAKQIEEIDRINRTLEGIKLLKGIEVDILEDGSLDLPDAILTRLDVVVGAVHSHFGLPRAKQTERVLRAMENPCFSILAHPTGRLIEERAPCDIDLVRVIRKARECGCHLELNAHPERLDLADTYCQMAKAEGILVSINSDAHGRFDFDNLRHGIDEARRGWLEKSDVLNARTLDELRPLIRRAPMAAAPRAKLTSMKS